MKPIDLHSMKKRPAKLKRTSMPALLGWGLLFVFGQGCGGCEPPVSSSDAGIGSGTDAGSFLRQADGGFVLQADGGVATVPPTDGGNVQSRALFIEPADSTLEATVGGSESLALNAYILLPDGTQETPDQSFWASLDPHIGSVDGFGVFTPSTERGGTARVRVRSGNLEALTTVKVVLHESVSLGGSSSEADFTGVVSAAVGPLVLYPENETVIPANLGPILFQWDKLATHARIELSGNLGSLSLFTDGDRVQCERDTWRRFIGVHIGQTVSVTISETAEAGAEVFESVLQLQIADADLTANVYYWAVDQGQIVRIDANSQQPTTVEIPYNNDAAGGVPADQAPRTCRACHTLSADGQHMAFTYFGGNGPGGVVDIRTPDAPILENRDDRRWNFAALNFDGSLLVSNLGKRLSMRSGTTGDIIGGLDDITGSDVAMPAWSPAGGLIAFAGDIRGVNDEAINWEIDFDRSNLYIQEIGGSTTSPTVGTPIQLVAGGTDALYYPSFSPDGSLLAYTKGTHSRSQIIVDEQKIKLDGTLHIASTRSPAGDGTAANVALAKANPQNNSFFPTFNPQVEGGYMWVAFYSRRDYGHLTRGEERPQIWVAAVDADADPQSVLSDPSHPAFWLPGQNVDTDNLSSFFAPSPCSESAGDCETDSACCGDLLCRPRGDGNNQCVPPEEACLLIEDTCEENADCCEGLECFIPEGTIVGVCDRVPEPAVCAEILEDCSTLPCCENNGVCLGDTCTFVGG